MRFYLFVLGLLAPSISLAIDMPPTDFMIEHADLFKWFLALAILILGWFIKKTLDHFKEDSDNQWKCIRDQDRRLQRIEVEHEIQHYGRRGHDFNHVEGIGDGGLDE